MLINIPEGIYFILQSGKKYYRIHSGILHYIYIVKTRRERLQEYFHS